MSASRYVTGRITIDLSGLRDAMRVASERLAEVSRRFTISLDRQRSPAETLRLRRSAFGGNGADAKLWPEQWQSAVCSAWLHESCPSAHRGLGCTCGCHAKAKP